MTFYGYKGINISYNMLNLPEKKYLQVPTKYHIFTMRQERNFATKTGSSFTYYRGDLIYNNDDLDHMMHPEGLAKKTSNGFLYFYMKKDHVGSVRALCYPNGTAFSAAQTTDYYPFGLPSASAMRITTVICSAERKYRIRLSAETN